MYVSDRYYNPNPLPRLPGTACRFLWIVLVLTTMLVPAVKAPAVKAQGKRTGLDATLMVPATLPQGSKSAERFSIIGNDDRFEIPDTHHFPWSAVVLVRIYWTADDLVGNSCTGWMIGHSALATAAHCIYQNGYAYRVVIKPAMNSDDPDQTPFGSCAVISGIVPEAWIQKRSIEYDYGVYRLGCSIGEKTGTLGFKATRGDWTQKPVQLTGYPNDKPGRTMWSAMGTVTSSSAKGMYYDVDMWPGQSGSPVWDTADKNCLYCVVAVNSGQFPAPAMNFGARIDGEAFDFLRKESAFQPETAGEHTGK